MSRAHRNFSFVLFVYLFVLIWREPYAYFTRSVILSFCLLGLLLPLFASVFSTFMEFGIFCVCYRSSSDSLLLPFFPVSLFFCSFALCLPCFRSAATVSHLASCPPLHIAPLYQPTNHPTQKKNNLYTKFSQQPACKIKSAPPSRIYLASRYLVPFQRRVSLPCSSLVISG